MKSRHIGYILLFFLIFSCPSLSCADFEFHPRLLLSQEYNDDIYLDDPGKDEDFITTVAPGISLKYRSRYLAVNGDYSLIFRKYKNNSEEDETDFNDIQRGLIAVDLLPENDFSLRISNEWSRVIIDERRPSSRENLRENRTTLSHFIFNPRYRFLRIPTYEFVFDYIYENLQYEDPQGDDSQSHGAGVEMIKTFSPRFSSSLDYRFKDYRGDDKLDNPDYQRHDATIGMIFKAYSFLTLKGRVGNAWINYDQSLDGRRNKDIDGIIWNVAADYHPQGMFHATLEYAEDFSDSVDEGVVDARTGRLLVGLKGRMPVSLEMLWRRAEYQLTDREEEMIGAILTGSIPLSRRLSLLLSGDYFYREYDPEGENVDDYGARGGLQYETRYVVFTLSHSIRKWGSNLPDESYTNNITLLSAMLRY